MSTHQHNTYHYDFTSGSALTHTITHNLSDLQPLTQIIRDDTNEVLIPVTIAITSANVVTITLAIARALRGRVTKGRILP